MVWQRLIGGIGISIVLLLLVQTAQAASLSFSITPTIFDMVAQPQQAWNSGVKVINNNDYDITVYASAVNFVPEGEKGHGVFLPITPTDDGTTLASWMTVPTEAIVIPKESSVVVPVNIAIPADASPGGHYAAVMIGTKPPVDAGKLEIKTSQIITALFFVRVAGDVVEDGMVRTFRTAHWFAGSPEMDFLLRFENKGTVHLQPQGEIRITNMWGKERGLIPINHETNFGNVLPNSIRLFEYSWRGEASMFDIGRYTAELTLAYGGESRKFETRSVSFWVVPLKPLFFTLLGLILGIWFITRSIRAYIRYMLRMSGVAMDEQPMPQKRYVLQDGDVRIERRVPVTEPVTAGYKDLKARLSGVTRLFDVLRVVWAFIANYPRFFWSLFGFVVLFMSVWWYLSHVWDAQRAYEVTIDNGAGPRTYTAEEIIYDKEHTTESAELTEQSYTLSVINAGAPVGTAGAVADQLTAASYRVDAVASDIDNPKQRSVIIYDPELASVATDISERLGGILISSYQSNGSTTALTIYLGSEYGQ